MAADISVLIADDHAVVRDGLKLFLELQDGIEVVAEAADGEEAVERAQALQPDIVLLDLVMPRLDGIQALGRIRTASPDTKVIVLTSFADDEKVFPALRAGAAAYLMKDIAPERLAEAIRTVYRGEPLLHPEVTRRLIRALSEARRAPEGTVTILFTDIVESTALVRELGDEASRDVLRTHDGLLRDVLRRHGGLEVKHQGDGLMIAFSSARRAVLCAVDIQRAVARHNRDHREHPLQVRVGLNTGEAIAEEQDYFGEAVIIASRIAANARGGQILVSDVAKALVGADAISFIDAGEQRLKGLGDHRLWEVCWEEDGQ